MVVWLSLIVECKDLLWLRCVAFRYVELCFFALHCIALIAFASAYAYE